MQDWWRAHTDITRSAMSHEGLLPSPKGLDKSGEEFRKETVTLVAPEAALAAVMAYGLWEFAMVQERANPL